MTNYSAKDHAFVICAYKENPFLPDCLESLKTQSIKGNIFMITSTPNDYITNICKKNNIPLLINTGEKGLAQDWNFAIDNMPDKKLITVVHQDDIYEPDYITAILSSINKSKNPLIAYTEYYEIRNDEKVYYNKLLRIKRLMNFMLRFRLLQQRRFIRRFILRFGDPVCCPAVTFVNDALPKPVFDVKFKTACDYKAWIDISTLKGSYIYIPRQLMGHRIHPESATSANIINNSKADEDFAIFSLLWPHWIAKILARFYSKAYESNTIN